MIERRSLGTLLLHPFPGWPLRSASGDPLTVTPTSSRSEITRAERRSLGTLLPHSLPGITPEERIHG